MTLRLILGLVVWFALVVAVVWLGGPMFTNAN